MKNLRIQINLAQYLQLQDKYQEAIKAIPAPAEGEQAAPVPTYLEWLSHVLQSDTLEVIP